MAAHPFAAERLLDVFGSSRMAIATKIALALVLEGMSYREAATITGCGDFADLYRTARRYGLTRLHLERAAKAVPSANDDSSSADPGC